MVVALALAAGALARIPGLGLFGPLLLALLLGLAVRTVLGGATWPAAGARFAASVLLKLGIVLLGVRLDFAVLGRVGLPVLLGSVLAVALGITVVLRLGRLLRLPAGLRTSLAVGTGVCGASAILAALPTLDIEERDGAVAVGMISVLGTVGVVAFAAGAALLHPAPVTYGLLIGFTMQEVGQVLAAGYAAGAQAGDVATLAKLTRVALLAPTLVVLSVVRRRGEVGGRRSLLSWRSLRLVPAFLVGFLLMALLHTLGAFGMGATQAMAQASLALTTAAMAGIGLLTDVSAFRRVGARTLAVGALGAFTLFAAMAAYTLLVLG